jgi:putative restriction endonuclease
MFDSDLEDGRAIWASVDSRIADAVTPGDAAMEPTGKYGVPVLMRPRLGQGAFRVLVTDAYKRRCAFTGESTLVALEAAHIVPYSVQGDHDVRNGLLLRADFHRLFDMGLVSVAPDLRIKVSPRIREAWFNGKIYYALDGKSLSVLPERNELRPDPDRLRWHNKEVFQA